MENNNFKLPKLIVEQNYWFKATKDQVNASKEKYGGKLIMSACLQRCDVKNQMGRVYPKELLEREFNHYQKLVDERCAYGERDHPNASVIEFKNVCHIVAAQEWKKSPEGYLEWWGDLEFLNNSVGKDMQAIIEDGVKVSVSSRGVGSVEHDNKIDADIVGSDLVMIGFDVVTNPSTHNANLILKEAYDLADNKDAFKRYLEYKIAMLNEINYRKPISQDIKLK